VGSGVREERAGRSSGVRGEKGGECQHREGERKMWEVAAM